MVIKKKSGEEYKLYGPNPLLVGQERWDADPVFKIHNFTNYKAEVYEIDEQLPKIEEKVIVIEEKKPEVKEVIKIETPKIEVPKVQEVDNKPKSEYRNLPRITFFCLPAKLEEIFDSLYQEKRVHVTYNSPFKFIGSIVKFTDVYFMVWTTVDKFSKYSIIYDGENKRWWKAGQIIKDPSGDGLLIHCSVSDLEPDFSNVM